MTIGFGNCMNSLADWLFSGKLAQFPGLRLMYAESQIGWIPYLLERADDVWKQHHAWVATGGEIDRAAVDLLLPPGVRLLLPRLPRAWRRSMPCGVDNVMFEVDYPHSDSTWPDSQGGRRGHHGRLSDADDRAKLVRANAIRAVRPRLPVVSRKYLEDCGTMADERGSGDGATDRRG